jgi:DNA-binding winged helix-turn-helix (wHTH) protein
MTIFRIGPFQLDPARLTLHAYGRPVALGPRVVETLLVLAENAGAPVEKAVLLSRIWPDGFVEESNLAQNVYVLRKTFREHGLENAIETVPHKGYRLVAPVGRVVELPTPKPNRWSAGRFLITAAAFGAVLALYAFGQANTGAPRGSTARLSPDAQRLYVIGRYYWDLRTPDGVGKSLDYFARVIDAAPQSALGYAAMADANVTMGDYCYGMHRPATYFARARSYAEKALVIDPDSAQAHAALGFADLHGGDAAFGLSELRRAIALDPVYAPAHEWLGIWLLRRGDTYRAVTELRSAANLEPLSASTIKWLGVAASHLKRPADAATFAREALELSPERRTAPLPAGHPRGAHLENITDVATR